MKVKNIMLLSLIHISTNMIYLLSGTGFKVSEVAHETVKNVLLTMRFYCNTKQWALSMSGRHPNGKGQLIPIQYATLALSLIHIYNSTPHSGNPLLKGVSLVGTSYCLHYIVPPVDENLKNCLLYTSWKSPKVIGITRGCTTIW